MQLAIRTALFAVLAALMLGGCAGTTLSQYMRAGYSVATDYTARTGRLIDADVITREEAVRRQENSKRAKLALDTAKDAKASCEAAGIADRDCLAAWASTDGVFLLLREVEAYAIKEGK